MAATPATKKATKKKVIIHSNDRENEEPELFVGLNGKTYQIKTREAVELDEDVINVLKDAKEIRHVAELKDGMPTGKTREEAKPRYIIEAV